MKSSDCTARGRCDVKSSDCRVLNETVEDEVRICKGKSIGEQWWGLCVVVFVIIIVDIILLLYNFFIFNVTFLSYFVVVKDKGKVYPRTFSLTWALGRVGSQRQAPAALLLEKNRSSHWLRGRVGPKAGLES